MIFSELLSLARYPLGRQDSLIQDCRSSPIFSSLQSSRVDTTHRFGLTLSVTRYLASLRVFYLRDQSLVSWTQHPRHSFCTAHHGIACLGVSRVIDLDRIRT